MTDWTKVAAGIDPAIDVEKIRPVIEGLEKAFDLLARTIPPGAEIWTGPEDIG
jgi:hypothetical protein